VQKNQISTPFQAVGKAIKWVANFVGIRSFNYQIRDFEG
jgi:hypothetical protein